MQQATLAIRARIPLSVLVDTMQPFPSFSGIYDSALMELSMAVADLPPPARPMAAQMSRMST
jgi:dihydrolipoamide dehydrogenase